MEGPGRTGTGTSPAGTRQLPLTRFLNHLRNTDYQSSVTIEFDPSEFPKAGHIILKSLKEILPYLRAKTGTQDDAVLPHDRGFQAVPMPEAG
ncbi:hypothetical protein [Oryzomonas sp.]|uniref:hypothetical protein n=1 Tax=Oryzomonas sp. TaxID=2855186 RepID=UPI00285291D0|nr:hypothetical protein [Oryzomonas sp.]